MADRRDHDHAAADFASLRARFANRELDADGERRLRALATGDVTRTAELDAVDDLLARFATERAVRHAAAAELDASAEASAELRALRAAADVAEDGLRQRCRAAGAARARRRQRFRTAAYCTAAAALLAVVAWLGFVAGSSAAPRLLPGAPDGGVLGGGALLEVESAVDRGRRVLQWSGVPGAARYTVVLRDAAQRPPAEHRIRTTGAAPRAALDAAAWRFLLGAAEPTAQVAAADADGVPIVRSEPVALRLVE